MRKTAIVGWVVLILIGLFLPQPEVIEAQDLQFSAGDKIILNQDLLVYAQPDMTSSEIVHLPRGYVVQIVRKPVETQNGTWWYIDEPVYGWLYQPVHEDNMFIVATQDVIDNIIEEYSTILADNPNDTDAMRLLAFTYLGNAEYVKAIEQMEVYINELPGITIFAENSHWMGWFGVMQFSSGMYRTAYQTLSLNASPEAETIEEHYFLLMQAQAENYYRRVTYTDGYFADLEQYYSDWPYFYSAWGERERVNESLFKAQLHYEQALGIDSDFDYAYRRLGLMFLDDLNDPYNALYNWEQAVLLNPNMAQTYGLRGVGYWATNEWQLAEDDFNEAINIDPKNSYGYFGLGGMAYQTNNYEDAVDFYMKAIQFQPYGFRANLNIGYCLRILGKPEAALPYFAQAAVARDQINFPNFSGDSAQAIIYYQMGDYANAEKHFYNYLNCCSSYEDNRDEVFPAIMYGFVLTYLGKYDEALDMYERAFDINFGMARRYQYGSDYFLWPETLSHNDERAAQNALNADAGNPDLIYQLAMEKLKIGLWEDAIANFRLYIEATDDVPEGFIEFVNELEQITLGE